MSEAPGSLRWRCRRGTRELDVLLERYVTGVYPAAPADEQGAFERILELSDPELTDYFLGHSRPGEPELAALVDRIATHRP